MELTEDLLNGLCQHLHDQETITIGDQEISFEKPFRRLVHNGLVEYAGLTEETDDRNALLGAAKTSYQERGYTAAWLSQMASEAAAEEHLIQPTFVTDFPLDVSPLSRKKDANPALVDL